MDLPEYKIILLGDTNVGKTTLYNAFDSGKADSIPVYQTTASTFISKEISLSNSEKILIQIWDTAGQENFRSITKTYFRDAKVAIICFEENGFNSIMEWIEAVREQNSECHFVIALTKMDSIDEEDIENITRNVESLIKNKIDFQEEIGNYKNENLFTETRFIPTSGKTLQNVNDLFQIAAEFYIHDKIFNEVNDDHTKVDSKLLNNEQKKSCC